MGRYGYLDMPEGWSDVDSAPVLAQCVDCGRLVEVEAEAAWIDDGDRYTACGCADLLDYRAEAEDEEAPLILAEEFDPRDVDDTQARVPCVECGRLVPCVVEDTWVDGGRTVTYCGCAELSEYRAEIMEDGEPEQIGFCEAHCGPVTLGNMLWNRPCDGAGCPYEEDPGWEQADLERSSRCDELEEERERERWGEGWVPVSEP